MSHNKALYKSTFTLTLWLTAFSDLTLLVGRQEWHPACKNWGEGGGGHWLVRMEWRPSVWSVSASVNLPLHHKLQKFSSGTGLAGWSRKKGHKTDVCVCVYVENGCEICASVCVTCACYLTC